MTRKQWLSGDALFRVGAIAMIVGGLSLVAASTSLVWQDEAKAPEPAAPDPAERCALPEGIDTSDLSSLGADLLVGRTVLCMDYEAGRLDREDYVEGLAHLEAIFATPLPEALWATAVRAVSSEYGTDSWGAQQLLGPADVFPGSGDNTLAWASLEEDDKVEWVEVEIPASRVSAVSVYETYNPGAIARIELVDRAGQRQRVFTGEPRPLAASSHVRTVEMPCTESEVQAVRVTLDSAAVPGWNELDAISVKPCR